MYIMVFIFAGTLSAQNGFSLVYHPSKKQLDLLYNGKLLTSYCYYDSIFKPVLFPIHTINGITITRGYPIHPLPGERTDHPHHIGLWLNYESVNGIDFWNNSTAIPAAKKSHYGTIKHERILKHKIDKASAILEVSASWLNYKQEQFLAETTLYHFEIIDSIFCITRSTTLTAKKEKVEFKDVKDGLLAIRVARELEMPSTEPGIFVGVDGKPGNPDSINIKTSGMYYNSDGVVGDAVWGTKAKWAMLKGFKDHKPITIAILDHKDNIGYPAYWHARGYGLFAVNPLGRKVFSKGNEQLNFLLLPNQSVTFKYRILIAEKNIPANIIEQYATGFNKRIK